MTPWASLIEPRWSEMVIDLRRWGIDDEAAAGELQVAESTYQAWLYGRAKPNYMNGLRFIAYHEHVRKTQMCAGDGV